MNKTVAFFHTTMNTPLPLKQAFYRRFPDDRLITVMDDSVLPEVIANEGSFTPGIVRRLVSFGSNAQMQGACVAMCMCTTLTEAVAQAGLALDIPFITIDGPMLDRAVREGERVALLITPIPPSVFQRSAKQARSGRDASRYRSTPFWSRAPLTR